MFTSHARTFVALALLAIAGAVSAQIPYTPAVPSTGVNDAFPAQNALAPTGAAVQVNYPYPGQCLASSANAALFPTTPSCADQYPSGQFGSFASPSQRTGVTGRTPGATSGRSRSTPCCRTPHRR